MNVKTSTYYIFIDGTAQLKADTKEIELNNELKYLKRKEIPKKKSLYIRTEQLVKQLNRKMNFGLKNKIDINKINIFNQKKLHTEIKYILKKPIEKEINNFSDDNKFKKLQPYQIFINDFEKEKELKKRKIEEKIYIENLKKKSMSQVDLRNKLRYYDFSKQLSRNQLYDKFDEKKMLPILTQDIFNEKTEEFNIISNTEKEYLCTKINLKEKIKYSKYKDKKNDILKELNKHYK